MQYYAWDSLLRMLPLRRQQELPDALAALAHGPLPSPALQQLLPSAQSRQSQLQYAASPVLVLQISEPVASPLS